MDGRQQENKLSLDRWSRLSASDSHTHIAMQQPIMHCQDTVVLA